MIIISLVGPVGVGKTTIIGIAKSDGAITMSEKYIDADILKLDNDLLLSKWLWVAKWYNTVLHLRSQSPLQVLSDRNPIEAAIWSPNTKCLVNAIVQSNAELASFGIKTGLIYLKCERDLLWERVQTRLLYEPERSIYKEDNHEYFNKMCDNYDEHAALWDFTIDVTSLTPKQVYERVHYFMSNYGANT